tara:strand:+ start:2696 stop:2842 length:147 start_codon:yes stop_codon:yes gene_type:complete
MIFLIFNYYIFHYNTLLFKKEGKEKYNNLLPFYREEIDKKNFGRSPDL